MSVTVPGLVAVDVTRGSATTVIRYEFDGPLPQGKELFVFGVQATSADGETVVRPTVQFQYGEVIVHAVSDAAAVTTVDDSDGSVTHDGNTVTADYPGNVFARAGEAATLAGYLQYDREDVAVDVAVTVADAVAG